MYLRNIRLCIFKSLVVVVFFTFVGTAHATKYIDVSAESVSWHNLYGWYADYRWYVDVVE